MADDFYLERKAMIARMAEDAELKELTRRWFEKVAEYNYSYNWDWMGRPIIQFPQDIVATQELIWEISPDVIVECGVARGGSLVLSASILEVLGKPDSYVVGVDIDIRTHNRVEIENHTLSKRIKMIEGSSIDESTVDLVRKEIGGKEKILVFLDSNHTHDHVYKEMCFYGPMVTVGSYMVVYDTAVEDMSPEHFADRPWSVGDNPKTAVWQYLKEFDNYEIDHDRINKLLITVAPDGYLKKIK